MSFRCLMMCGAFLAAALMIGCADDAQAPEPDVQSIWYQLTSSETLPDTLYQGEETSFELALSDSDGSDLTVTVDGLPAAFYRVRSSGDTTFVSIDDLAGDSLKYDSLYMISITATGGADADSLTLSYVMRVGDTTRLGGVRRLIEGTWWTTVKYDTVVVHTDSGTGDTLKSTDLETRAEHHIYSRVENVFKDQGAYYYVVATYDTLMSDRSVKEGGVVVRHSDTALDYSAPLGLPGLDTIRIKYLDLPPVVGTSWDNGNFSFDTGLTFKEGSLNIPVKVHYALSLRARLEGTSAIMMGSAPLRCFDLVDSSRVTGVVTLDTTIAIAGWDTLNVGDTSTYTTENTVAHVNFGELFSAVIRSYAVKTVRDTNYFEFKVEYRTEKTETMLTSYYDPRRNLTFRREN